MKYDLTEEKTIDIFNIHLHIILYKMILHICSSSSSSSHAMTLLLISLASSYQLRTPQSGSRPRCGPWTSCISAAWDLVGNAESKIPSHFHIWTLALAISFACKASPCRTNPCKTNPCKTDSLTHSGLCSNVNCREKPFLTSLTKAAFLFHSVLSCFTFFITLITTWQYFICFTSFHKYLRNTHYVSDTALSSGDRGEQNEVLHPPR